MCVGLTLHHTVKVQVEPETVVLW